MGCEDFPWGESVQRCLHILYQERERAEDRKTNDNQVKVVAAER
ncbi:hypothetical protein ES705_09931 [subsurface metagenome]